MYFPVCPVMTVSCIGACYTKYLRHCVLDIGVQNQQVINTCKSCLTRRWVVSQHTQNWIHLTQLWFSELTQQIVLLIVCLLYLYWPGPKKMFVKLNKNENKYRDGNAVYPSPAPAHCSVAGQWPSSMMSHSRGNYG